jgi:hypothetical protein
MNSNIKMTREDAVRIKSERLGSLLHRTKETMGVSVDSVPSRYQYQYLRALNGEVSARAAIKSKCLECVGFEDAVERIRECRVMKCAIRAYRPFQSGSNDTPDTDQNESMT